ncbi:glycosyltransferase [Motilimonas pumila]|uniref:Glycosyltransferase n=1 Tax=Motilimonas pumila TaxID=2303987 RepID=A0A418YD58_9GAMM|nr:glycosyltransferase [Motilimonas pumila]RJG42465.1 glycosyltransferase [Motilimonas pumila]
MKTCMQIVQHLKPGGIESLCLDLVSFAPAHEQTYIVSLEGNLEQALTTWPRLAAYKEKLLFINKGLGFSFSCVIKLKALIKQYRISAIHSHHIGPLLYGALAAKMAGIHCHLHTEHDAWHLHSLKHRMLQRFACAMSQPALIADAEFVAAKAGRFMGNKQAFKVIKNGIDCERFGPAARIQPQARSHPQIVIGCSGRLEWVKGHRYLLQAMALLPAHFTLQIAGDGSERANLVAMSQALGIADRVCFLGQQQDMASFYPKLDLFCLPSVNEGYPLAPLEAQACGIPCVITDVGGAKECLCPSIGTLVPAKAPQQLAQAIIQLHLSAQLLGKGQVTKATRNFVKNESEVRQMTTQYAALRRDILNQGGTPCGSY